MPRGGPTGMRVHPLIEILPLPQRLALAHARGRLRGSTLGLLALDAHLATLVRQAREPLLAQMRLAWWRERLQEPAGGRPKGDPLLDLLASWEGYETALAALVDGWEHLLADRLDDEAIGGFAGGRAAAFGGLAALAGEVRFSAPAARAGERWALADLAAHLGDPEERAKVLREARTLGQQRRSLPRSLRPLAVLDGLAVRAIGGGGAPLAEGPLAGLAALRLGIFGR